VVLKKYRGMRCHQSQRYNFKKAQYIAKFDFDGFQIMPSINELIRLAR
jgi:hypothetical protein